MKPAFIDSLVHWPTLTQRPGRPPLAPSFVPGYNNPGLDHQHGRSGAGVMRIGAEEVDGSLRPQCQVQREPAKDKAVSKESPEGSVGISREER